MSGTLYIVATPIGNLGDITPRVKETLIAVDLILAEDTRVTIKLLNHLGIKKRMISCHDFNEKSRLSIVSQYSRLNQKVALVSDAGTPLVSDPGSEIVRQAIDCGMKIISIPGASAFLLALVSSGLPCDRFVFEGFLPSKASLLKQRLEELQLERRTLIIYEAPHRLLKTLAAIKDVLGERKICLARELTKLHEETIRGGLSEIIATVSAKSSKILGEYVLVIEGCKKDDLEITTEKNELPAKIVRMLQSGQSVKTIVQEITRTYKMKRSEVYQLALRMQREQEVKNR